MALEEPQYKNYISRIDINRDINSVSYLSFKSMLDSAFDEFRKDMTENNDIIELSLLKNNAYNEAVILQLRKDLDRDTNIFGQLLVDEQKTFSGSKLFYLNEARSRILVLAIPGSMEGKLSMAIQRLNKINDKIMRMNQRIRKENQDMFASRARAKDKRDRIVDMINKNLKV
ncbi:hypothetical protein J4212_05200 [Candidatus Woesearchaeota archaeon]|nr:hypothetical protein [Candidatus Woesearchaeota archaeon]